MEAHKHYFVNPHYHKHGKEPYRFLEGTDMEMNSHITTNTPETPDGDRYFTKDLENGLPPQYEQ